jgi:hypothetical protein
MSTTINGATGTDLRIAIEDGLVRFGIYADNRFLGASYPKPEDLLAALRAEGVLDGDDGAQEKLEKVRDLIRILEPRPLFQAVVQDLKHILNPPAPYQFPTGLGAVVEGVNGTVTTRLINIGFAWHEQRIGTMWPTDGILEHFTNLRTLSEGVEL